MTQAGARLRILLVDSGVGGLPVLMEVRKLLPQAEIIYMADTAAFPHSDQEQAALAGRMKTLIHNLAESAQPDMVVVTGSTVSSLMLEELQAQFSFPIVGSSPALESGVGMTGRACVGLLETEATLSLRSRREWVDQVAPHCKVVRVGTSRMAGLAERRFRGLPIDQSALVQEAGALFLDEEEPAPDAVVLGSSHFWFLLEELRRLGPPETLWIEPGLVLAQRVRALAARLGRPAGRRPLEGGGFGIFSRLSPSERRGVERGCAAFGVSRLFTLDPVRAEGRARLSELLARA